MYTDFNHFLLLQHKCMTHKSKITPATSPLFCNPLPSKTDTTATIDALFRMRNILKFTQNSLVVRIPYLLCDFFCFTRFSCL